MGAIWEQLEGESHKAYAAFCVFRDMLPGERTYAKVAEKLGYHWSGVAKWASPNRFNWQERAAAYDAYKSRNQIELRQADLVEAQQHVLQQEGTEIAAAMLLVTRTYQELL